MFHMLKYNSRLALRGNWGKALTALFICFVLSGTLSLIQQYALDLFVPAGSGEPDSVWGILTYRAPLTEIVILTLFLLLVILLGAPLQFGVMAWYYRLVQGHPGSITGIFVFFERPRLYLRALWLYITLFVRAALWAFLFTAFPGATLSLSLAVFRGQLGFAPGNPKIASAVGGMGFALSLVLLILAMALYLVFMGRYALVPYLFAEDPDRGFSRLIRDSARFSKGYRVSLFGYSLSFAGWFAMCIALFPALYVLPYYNTATAMYARYIIERSRRESALPTREFSLDRQQESAFSAPGPEAAPQVGEAELPHPPDCDGSFPKNTIFPAGESDRSPFQGEIPSSIEDIAVREPDGNRKISGCEGAEKSPLGCEENDPKVD